MASRAKTYFDPKGIFLAPAGARGPQIENQPRDFVVHYKLQILEPHMVQTCNHRIIINLFIFFGCQAGVRPHEAT